MAQSNVLPFEQVLQHTPRPFLPKAEAKPFIKWAGGKRSLVPKISEHLPEDISRYHEPFVGGGAVFFSFQHLINKANLADLNQELILAYFFVQNETEKLIEKLSAHAEKHALKNGYYIKTRRQIPKSRIDTAARFLYLNKTCFNGLYRVNKSGLFNVPEGSYKKPNICDPDNLRSASAVLQKADLKFGQFDKSIHAQQGDFIYCDPPYDDTFTGYQPDGFDKGDQTRLKEKVDAWTKLGANVMLSNSDTPFIRDLYKGYSIIQVTAPRNISCKGDKREKAAEVLIVNYE